MTNRRPRTVKAATTPIQPGVGAYPAPDFLTTDDDAITQDIIDKLNAGGRLLFALYHHPQAKELMTSPYMTNGLMRAYMAACKAWGL